MNIYFFAIVLLMACILVLEAIKNAPGNSGVQAKKYVDIGKSMTIGSREVQEDQVAAMETAAGIMAVLADGAGQAYGGRIARYVDIGKSMTIGSREVQEDQVAAMETAAGIMAVLADGAGQAYGGRIASKIAVETCMDIFKDYNAFNNPQYYFRKAYNCANKEILKALGDERRGSASVGCVLICQGFLYYALVGNVKICVYREENLVPVSSGHTVAVLAEQKFHEGTISRPEQ